MTRALVLEARLLGVKVPFPSLLPHDDFASVARWIARRKSEGFECMLSAAVSNAVRVASAAADHGCNVSGTVVRVHSEALWVGDLANGVATNLVLVATASGSAYLAWQATAEMWSRFRR